MSNCTAELSASLSALYRSNEQPYVGPLNQYLSRNGILLTMCLGFFGEDLCALPREIHTISASWVQANSTGFSIFREGIREFPQVGYLLNPKTSDVQCMYPFDGGTLSRTKNGCGYDEGDTKHMGFFTRWLARIEFRRFKNEEFGRHTKWEDIDCEDFFGDGNTAIATAPRGEQCLEAMREQLPLMYQSEVVFSMARFQELMGHSVCTLRDKPPPPISNSTMMVVYLGECSWEPENWTHMLHTMMEVLKDHRNGVWNEIVLKKPKRLQDVVQGVFYVVNDTSPVLIDDDFVPDDDEYTPNFARAYALKEALRLGLPLFQVDPTAALNGDDLFSCVDDWRNMQQTSMLESMHAVSS